MTRRLWIADEHSGKRAAIIGNNARHLAQVLRARVGQQFDVGCGDDVYLATISSITPQRVEFDLGERVARATLPNITLVLAVFKFDRLEWAIEKATELGVTEIIPVVTRRTESNLAKAAQKRIERWRKLAREASQQSRRALEPTIGDPAKLGAALTRITAARRFLLAETEKSSTLRDLLAQVPREEAVALAIGPEGGWAEDELDLFAKNGWSSGSLGPTILRAETAAISAITLAALR